MEEMYIPEIHMCNGVCWKSNYGGILMNRLLINFSYILKTSFKWTASFFAILGFIGTFTPLEELIDYSEKLWKKILISILILVGIWVVSFIIISLITLYKKQYTILEINNHKVFVQYGDLFSSDEVSDTKNRNIVVPVNRCFDTLVDDDLISSNTLHGMAINKLISEGYTRENIDDLIDSNLMSQKCQYSLINANNKRSGKLKRYPVGTVAEVKATDDCNYFLLGLSSFDENLVANVSDDEYVLALSRLIEFCNKRSQQYPVVMPLIGGGLSRTGKSEREILEYLVSLIKLNKNKLHYDLYIVIRENGRSTIPIVDL